MKKNWEKIKTSNVLGTVLVSFNCAIIFLLLFFDIPTANKEIFNTLITYLQGASMGAILMYFFDYKKDAPKAEVVAEVVADNKDSFEKCEGNCGDCECEPKK